MSQKQAKKLRRLYRKDLAAKHRDVFNHLMNNKPWYIPTKLWIHWLLYKK